MEAVGGVLLVLGVGTRWVSLALVPILLGAMWAHLGNGWVFSNANGGWEYPLYLAVLALAHPDALFERMSAMVREGYAKKLAADKDKN